ncbi:hypothetical protein GWN26_06180, partial [Candidatus Saccharibacteria bacterium]|nr:hypothetical protein [Candidatus Saccharibacteria bacterium]
RLEEAQKNNHSIAEAKEKIEYFSGQITQTEKEIVELQKKIKNAEEVKKRYINERRELDKKIENEKPVDVLPIQ